MLSAPTPRRSVFAVQRPPSPRAVFSALPDSPESQQQGDGGGRRGFPGAMGQW